MKIETYQLDTVKQKVTVRNALSLYLPENRTDSKGFMCCPFHSEKTPSMKVHNAYFHCFGCGESGDVITLTRKLFGLGFETAVAKLDSDFCLGLNLGAKASLSQRINAYRIAREADRKREAYEKLRKREFKVWLAFEEKMSQLYENKKKYKPKPTDPSPHPLFTQALADIPRYLSMWDEFDLKIKKEREQLGFL